MEVSPTHVDKILIMQQNARKAGPDFDVAPIIEIEMGEVALELFQQGWSPVDIRDYCHSMNRMLRPGLSQVSVDRCVARSLQDWHDRIKGAAPTPGGHIKMLESEVKSWGENFAFDFGIRALDEAWGGLMPGEVGVLVGAQGAMKTSLALQGIVHTLQTDPSTTVLVFSLDMSAREFAARFLLRDLGVSLTELYGLMRNPTEDYLRAKQAFSDATDGRLKILGNSYKGRWSIDGVELQVGIHLPSLVVVDFLTCLKKQGQSDLEGVEEIMPRIQGLAQKLGTKFLLLSQMGRASKSDQLKGAVGGHGKGGGIVEELAHAEIELLKDAPETPGGGQRIIATVTKTRRGQNGASFDLVYKGRSMEFTGQAFKVERERDRKPLYSMIDTLKGGSE